MDMATTTEVTDELARRVQNLPAELFEDIYDLVFSINGNIEVKITKDYKTPAILQVNRYTRNELAPRYYAQTIFVYDTTKASRLQFGRWLSSLSGDHLWSINSIRQKDATFSKPTTSSKLQSLWQEAFARLRLCGLAIIGEKADRYFQGRLSVEGVAKRRGMANSSWETIWVRPITNSAHFLLPCYGRQPVYEKQPVWQYWEAS